MQLIVNKNIEDVLKLHQQGKLAEAKTAYLVLLEKNPNNVQALHYLSVLFAEEGQLTEAKRYLQQAINLAPNDLTLLLHLANLNKAQGEYDEARVILQELIHNYPGFAAAFNNLGTVYYAQQNWQEAVAAYQKAIDIQPNYIDAYYNLGLAWNKLNHADAAMHAFDALLDLAPQHPGAQFQKASLLMRDGKLREACIVLETLAKNYPYHAETQSNLAVCYLRLGDLARSMQHYLSVLSLVPNDVQALFNLGVINMQLGKIDDAAKYYAEAVRQDNDLYEGHNNLGFIYLLRKDKELALKHFHEALRIKPDNEALRHTITIIAQDKPVKTSPPAYIEALFDSYADHFDTHLQQALHYQVPALIYQASKMYAELSGAKLLDLGCGTGLTGELFKHEVKSLTGVDLSAKMLAIAAQKNIYKELVQAELVDFLNAQPQQFEIIVAGDVLVYSGEVLPIFIGAYKSLKAGGIFVFNVEQGDKEDYQMTGSGRFIHKRDYIDKMAAAAHLEVAAMKAVTLRTQADVPVQGYLYVLRKPA